MKKKLLSFLCSCLLLSVPFFLSGADLSLEWQGWQPYSPRDEIRPDFSLRKKGGPDGKGGLGRNFKASMRSWPNLGVIGKLSDGVGL